MLPDTQKDAILYLQTNIEEENIMKKVLSVLLVLAMCFAFVACGSSAPSAEEKVAKYVSDNRTTLLSTMESSFATSSGLTCESDIKAIGRGFVIDIKINELENIPAETKAQMQSMYDSMGSTFDASLEQWQKEIPELEYYKVNLYDKNGDSLATISAG